MSSNPETRTQRPWAASLCFGVVAAFAWGLVQTLDPRVPALLPVSFWLVGIAACAGLGRALLGRSSRRSPPLRGDVLSITALLLLFALCWLPFYGDWRWAYTGDSLTWFWVAEDSALHGLHRSLLSIVGVDHHFTYLHSLASNFLLFAVEPSFFWHRVGKLLATCASLLAIFAFFRLWLERGWALALVACLIVNSVFLWFSYVSYGHIDSFFFYYGVLSIAVVGNRHSDDWRVWYGAGLLGGLAGFFTQTSWSGVLAGGVVLMVIAARDRRYRHFGVAVLTALCVTLPLLLQWERLWSDMIRSQAQPVWAPDYLWRTAYEIALYPYRSRTRSLGVLGEFLRPPGGALYLVGCVLSLLSWSRAARDWLRIPEVAKWLGLLLLYEITLLTLTNNGYLVASTKRVYSLLPIYAGLAMVPLVALWRVISERGWSTALPAAALAGAFTWYAWGNVATIVWPTPGLYGYTTADGLVELRQRFGDGGVTVFSTKDDPFLVNPGGILDRAYDIAGAIEFVRTWDAGMLERRCAATDVVCFDMSMERAEPWGDVDAIVTGLEPLSMLNCTEMRCYRCGLD